MLLLAAVKLQVLTQGLQTLMGSSFPGSTLSWSMIPADTGLSLSKAFCRLMLDHICSSAQQDEDGRRLC